MEKRKREYAQAGVDYTKAQPFREAMQAVGRRTLHFPNKRDVFVNEKGVGTHGAIFEYRGGLPHLWSKTQESLGTQNWVAEWMYQNTGKTYYDAIGFNLAQIIVVDVIAEGGLPVVFTDEVATDSYDWGMDELRSRDFAKGIYEACKICGMALPAGESSALRYLVKAEPPVISAPVLSGCITGIVAPKERLITGRKLQIDDRIIAVASSGIHSNGISLVIKRALTLKDQFLHKLPNGKTLGEETLIPARCYVALVEALLEAKVDVHAFLPGTGGGPSKIAFDKRPFTYRIHSWFDKIPPLFLFMQELGVTLEDCLTTFNWGSGYYIFVPLDEVNRTIDIGKRAGYELLDIGRVEKGERKVVFEPEGITLPPPGE